MTTPQAKKTSRGYEVRLRIGGGERLEDSMPAHLTQGQANARLALLITLKGELATTKEWLPALRMLREIATAPTTEDAQTLARLARRFVRENQPKPPRPGEHTRLVTVEEFGQRWTSGKLAAAHPDYVDLKESAADDAQRLGVMYGVIGKIPLAKLTLSDAERAMANLPKTVRSRNTRRQYAIALRTLLELAVFPARLIDSTPLPRKWLPKGEDGASHTWLYPEEDARLLGCPKVPARRRLLYGFADREGMRISHILRIRYRDIDFDRGTITVGKVKATKTGKRWKLNAGVAAAIAACRGNAKDSDLVFELTNNERIELSTTLRNDLRTAGVLRNDIHHASDDGSWMPLRFHDLRATFVTWHLALGHTPEWVTARTGHKSYQMLAAYTRDDGPVAQAREEGITRPLPLDEAMGLRPAGKIREISDASGSNANARGRELLADALGGDVEDEGAAAPEVGEDVGGISSPKKKAEGKRVGRARIELATSGLKERARSVEALSRTRNSGKSEGDEGPNGISPHSTPTPRGDTSSGLEDAIAAAAAAGQWAIVAQLTTVLERRR